MARTTVDKRGRVLIPKAIRDSLDLQPGTILELEQRGDGLLLTPADADAYLKYEKGILVFTGRPTGDMTNIIQKVRDDRDRQIMGMDGKRDDDSDTS